MKLKVFSSTIFNFVSDRNCFYQATQGKSQECRDVFIYDVFLEYLIELISCVELNQHS